MVQHFPASLGVLPLLGEDRNSQVRLGKHLDVIDFTSKLITSPWMWSLSSPMAMPARWDGPACWGNWLEGAPAALPAFPSLVEPGRHGLLVSGSRGRAFVAQDGGQPPPSPTPAPSQAQCLIPCPQERTRQGNVCSYECLFAHTAHLDIWLGRLVHMIKWARKH